MINRKFLWIGCIDSDEQFEERAKNGQNLASAQVSQKNIMFGIEELTNEVFDSINASVLPPYPIYPEKDIKQVIWSHKKDAFDISVGYKNIKYLNRLDAKRQMIKAAKNWIDTIYNGEELIIYAYSMRSSVMATACYIKKNIPNTKIYLIITDLPQFMDLGESKVKKFLKRMDWIEIKNMKKKFDGFILYAEKMAEFLGISDEKWILMEGLYNEKESIEYSKINKDKNIIMYSGKLDIEYGIDMLLNAFMKIIDEDLELWLTGGGNAEKYINECIKKDNRIKFYGFLPSRNDVIEMQKRASLLINMRLPSEKASEYCFPSKLLEYMATEIPVLSFKLEGIPKEYYDYMFLIENEDEQSIINAINDVFKMDPIKRKEIGIEAKNFILKNKSINTQAKKIIEWMNSR